MAVDDSRWELLKATIYVYGSNVVHAIIKWIYGHDFETVIMIDWASLVTGFILNSPAKADHRQRGSAVFLETSAHTHLIRQGVAPQVSLFFNQEKTTTERRAAA